MLLLETRGRKSGEARRTPVYFVRDGADVIVVASNWGRDDDPAWYRNLMARPDDAAMVVDGRRTAVRPEAVAHADRERVWKAADAAYPQYADYRKWTRREIPLVRLMPR